MMKRNARKGSSGSAKPHDSRWGSMVKSMREAQRMSQEELAHELDVTTGALRNWERGLNAPGLRARRAIAKFGESRGFPASVWPAG